MDLVTLEQHCLQVACCIGVAACLHAKACLPGMVQPAWSAALLTLHSASLTLFLHHHAAVQWHALMSLAGLPSYVLFFLMPSCKKQRCVS